MSGLQSCAAVQTSNVAGHSGPCSRYGQPYGSRDVYIRASHSALPVHASDGLAVYIGLLTAEDFHLSTVGLTRLMGMQESFSSDTASVVRSVGAYLLLVRLDGHDEALTTA